MSETEIKAQGQKPKTSKLAIVSMVCGIIFFMQPMSSALRIDLLWHMTFYLRIISIPLAPICGILALIKIKKSNGMLKGIPCAIVGIAAGVYGLGIVIVIASVWLYGI